MKNAPRQHGFSLIEVMVATVLLMVIVMMVGLVFRQNVLMWNSGMRRAEGMSLVRVTFGSIERDLRNAVDGTRYKGWNIGNGGLSEPPLYVSGDGYTLSFVSFLGEDDDCEPMRVTYNANDSGSLTRKIVPLRWNDALGQWRVVASLEMSSVLVDEMRPSNSVDGPQKPQVDIEFYAGPPNVPPDAVRYVTVKAKLISAEDFASVRVRSLGEDGVRNNPSTHIVVW